MSIINLAIRTKEDIEPKSYNVLLADKPNLYGYYHCIIVDDSLDEIFSTTKSDSNLCSIELIEFINKLGTILNIYEIQGTEEIKEMVQRLKEMQ